MTTTDTTTDVTARLDDILTNGFRVLPGPTAFAALLDVASMDQKVAMHMKLEKWIGWDNTNVLFYAAEGVRSGRTQRAAKEQP